LQFSQHIPGFVKRIIVYHNDFMGGGVVLYQQTGQVAGQVFVFITGTNNHGYRMLLRNLPLIAFMESYPVEKEEIIKQLYKRKQCKAVKYKSLPVGEHGREDKP
jgi:hypothetical protein